MEDNEMEGEEQNQDAEKESIEATEETPNQEGQE